MSWKKRKKKLQKNMASEGSTPSQKKAESIQSEKQTADERHYPPPFPSSIEVQFPRRMEETYNASQQKQDGREKWKIILEGLTVLFVFGSMIVSLYMWNEMRKATEAAKLSADAAAASTAAWIVIERFVIKSIEKDQIMFNVTFKNVGKTTALDARAGWEFTLTAPSTPIKLDDVPKYDPWQCPEHLGIHLGIVKPDGLWSNEGDTGTGKMSVEQLQMIKNRTARLFIHGCAKYRDILTDRERITEFGVYYPGTFDPTDMSVAIHAPYNRMK